MVMHHHFGCEAQISSTMELLSSIDCQKSWRLSRISPSCVYKVYDCLITLCCLTELRLK